jgi:acyl dehydratase
MFFLASPSSRSPRIGYTLTPMRTITGIQDLTASAGTRLGESEWQQITQDTIDAFARVTGDFYWIHTDPVRAAETQIGVTIAHGLLTLALGPALNYSIVNFEGFTTVLNYGYDRVRFPARLSVDSELRMTLDILDVEPSGAGTRARLRQTFEVRGASRPACVADQVLHFMTSGAE